MPESDLPGYSQDRLGWQAPTVLPTSSLAERARSLQAALQGIYKELVALGDRRNVVALQGDTQAREGQVIAGVASGEVITLPSPNPGELGTISVLLQKVKSACSAVNPDGSTYRLDQPGLYEFSIAPEDRAWLAPPGLSSSGSAAGAQVLLGAAHGSYPNGRVATDTAELDVDTSIAGIVSWALRDGSIGVARLQDQSSGTFCAQLLGSTGAPRFWDGTDIAGTGIDWTLRLSNGPSPSLVSIDAAVRDQLFQTSALSISVALPINRIAGHRILMLVKSNSSVGGAISPVNTPAGWTRVLDAATNNASGLVIERILDGTETSPLTVTTANTSGHIVHIDLIADSNLTLASQGIARSLVVVGTTVDAPRLNVTLGVARYLSVQYLCTEDEAGTITDPTDFPTGYNDRGQVTMTDANVLLDGTVAYCSLRSSVAAGGFDPSAWAYSVSQRASALNVAVPPRETYSMDVSASSAQIASSFSANLFVYAAPNRNTGWGSFIGTSLDYSSAISSGEFPIVTVASCATGENSNTAQSFALPTEALVPALPTRLIAWFVSCNGGTISTPTGWTAIGATVTVAGTSLAAFFLDIAAGASPTNPINITLGSAAKCFCQFKSYVDYDAATAPESVTATVLAALTLDMGAIAPSWSTLVAAKTDYTFAIAFPNETTGLVSAYPASYTGGTQTLIPGSLAGDDGGFAICHRQVSGLTEDPAAITWTGASNAAAMLVAVAPARRGKLTRAALTGDVTAPLDSNVTTIAANAVTHAKEAQPPANTIAGNWTVGVANMADNAVGTNVVVGRGAGNVVAAQLVAAQVTPNTLTAATQAQMAANTVKSNATAALADESDLAMGASTILARLAAGNIVAATPAQVEALMAAATTGTQGPILLASQSDIDTGTNATKAVTPNLRGLRSSLKHRNTVTTVTNSTAAIDCTGSFTIAANTLIVGSSFRVRFAFQFLRGATATALNLGAFMNVGGTAISVVAAAASTLNGFVGFVECEAVFTVLTTGVGGTAFAFLRTIGNAAAGGAFGYAAANTNPFAIDTTIANAINGTANMNTAVAACTLNAMGGDITPIA